MQPKFALDHLTSAKTSAKAADGPAAGWIGWPILARWACWAISAALLVLVLLIYIQRIAFYLPAYRYQINPDGVGYLSVARHWLDGHWADAINAYWSPLYSWLMVPLLAYGFDPLLTAKLVNAFAGAVAIASVWRLGHHVGIRPELRAVACLAMIPFLAYNALWLITPDLLVAAMLLAYLAAACSLLADPAPVPNDGWRRWFAWRHSLFARAAIMGLAAGSCYLAKAYALPVVIGHFLLMGTLRIATARGRRVRAALAVTVGLLVFAVIVGGWSAALSVKFGYVMTGSTGRYNYYLDGPHSTGQPMDRGRLIPPPNPSAVTIWEDPTSAMPPAWNPFNSQAEWDHQIKLLDHNWAQLLSILRDALPVWPLALAAGILTILAARRPICRYGALATVVMVVAYPLGYLLLHVEDRFLMLEPPLLIFIGVQAIGAVSVGRWFIRWPLQWIAVALVFWTPVVLPTQPRPARWRTASAATVIPPLISAPGRLQQWETAIESAVQWAMDRSIVKSAEKKLAPPPAVADRSVIDAADALAGKIPPGSRVASVQGRWDNGVYTCFFLGLRHFGTTAPPARTNDVEQQWIDHKIEFIFWQTRRPPILKQLDLQPVAAGVWRITPKPPTPSPSLPATHPATRPVTRP